MTLSDLLQRIKLQVPNINEIGVSDPYLTTLLNQACDQVNLLTKVYKTDTVFNIEADKMVYNLSSIVPTYLGSDKRGLFLLDANSEWQDVIPKTEAWLSETYPDYLNSSSVATPQYYWIDGDDLGIYPPASSDTTNGGKLFHLKKSTSMTEGTHYPFTGSATQITAFIPLDDALIAYVRWKLSPAFGQVTDIDLREREFISECRKGAMQIKRRKDLMNDSATYMRL
jgi:hypothetical protein